MFFVVPISGSLFYKSTPLKCFLCFSSLFDWVSLVTVFTTMVKWYYLSVILYKSIYVYVCMEYTLYYVCMYMYMYINMYVCMNVCLQCIEYITYYSLKSGRPWTIITREHFLSLY